MGMLLCWGMEVILLDSYFSQKWGFVYSNCPPLSGRKPEYCWDVECGLSSDNGNDAQKRLNGPITVNIPLMRCSLGNSKLNKEDMIYDIFAFYMTPCCCSGIYKSLPFVSLTNGKMCLGSNEKKKIFRTFLVPEWTSINPTKLQIGDPQKRKQDCHQLPLWREITSCRKEFYLELWW